MRVLQKSYFVFSAEEVFLYNTNWCDDNSYFNSLKNKDRGMIHNRYDKNNNNTDDDVLWEF